jgi:hypothetical protein
VIYLERLLKILEYVIDYFLEYVMKLTLEESFTFSRLKNIFEKLQVMLSSNVKSVSNKPINVAASMSLITTDRLLVLGNGY